MKIVCKKKVLIPRNNQSQSDVALNVAKLFNNTTTKDMGKYYTVAQSIKK